MKVKRTDNASVLRNYWECISGHVNILLKSKLRLHDCVMRVPVPDTLLHFFLLLELVEVSFFDNSFLLSINLGPGTGPLRKDWDLSCSIGHGWFGSIPVPRKVEALIRPICPLVRDNIKGPWFFFSITFNCGDSTGELRIALLPFQLVYFVCWNDFFPVTFRVSYIDIPYAILSLWDGRDPSSLYI